MQYMFLRFPDGRAKAVTFSYDDGAKEDIEFAKIINRYGIKCTFNYTNSENLTKEDITKYILSNGHEIAIHGANHRAEGLIRPIEAINDILLCRKKLETNFKNIIRGMAYPDSGIRNIAIGNTYEKIRQYLINLDIAYARTLGNDNDSFRLPEDWYSWTPTAHHKNPKLMAYIEEFLKIDISELSYISDRYPRLFYLWGHSREFEKDNNWDYLEKICEKLSGKSGIWYATNMEIYDYVGAYNSLILSVDNAIIYNPTLFEIWFEIDGKPYSIKSGETIHVL